MRIAIVAGEASGDFLAAELIRAIREQHPAARFEGIAGPQMVAAGCRALFPSEALSVMGLFEVLRHLPRLLRIRKQLRQHLLAEPPDLFIGVDAPDFNLPLERQLKRRGITTVHYVSPSVWAWREKRVEKIHRSVDLMLTLFPFEQAVYQAHGVPVRFVGHPLAEVIPEQVEPAPLRAQLNLPATGPLVALLPGSRMGEVSRLADDFIETARWLHSHQPQLHFIVPFATAATRQHFEQRLSALDAEGLPITLMDGHSRDAMGAADAVLLASGTATLEALLLNRPMVIAYRLSPLTYQLAKRLLRVPYYSLPNNLAGEYLVEEYTQAQVSAENLGPAVMKLLDDPNHREGLQQRFAAIRRQLQRRSSHEAAQAVLALTGRQG
ncbi:MAG: lipid-A-disaccharide synthase [Pseudomonadota bacterium]